MTGVGVANGDTNLHKKCSKNPRVTTDFHCRCGRCVSCYALQPLCSRRLPCPYGLLKLQTCSAGFLMPKPRSTWLAAFSRSGQASLGREASTFTFACHVECLARYMALAQGLPKRDASVSTMQQAFCRPWVVAASTCSSGPTSTGSRQTRSLQLKRPTAYYSGDTLCGGLEGHNIVPGNAASMALLHGSRNCL